MSQQITKIEGRKLYRSLLRATRSSTGNPDYWTRVIRSYIEKNDPTPENVEKATTLRILVENLTEHKRLLTLYDIGVERDVKAGLEDVAAQVGLQWPSEYKEDQKK